MAPNPLNAGLPDNLFQRALAMQVQRDELAERVALLEAQVSALIDEVAPLRARIDELEREVSFGGRAARRQMLDVIAPPGSGSRFRSAVAAALKRGKAWELTELEYYQLADSSCVYCGNETGKGIGLDRVDSKLSYTWRNVVPCCGPCNWAKGRRVVTDRAQVEVSARRSGQHLA